MAIKVIAENEVVVSRRGRVAKYDPELQTAFKSLKAGQALDLTEHFGGPLSKTADRQRVGQEIRKNWKSVRKDECRLDFGGGLVQVRIKK